MKRYWICMLMFFSVATSCGGNQKSTAPPNVIVILIDTLRPDYLGAYGAPYETAPFLGRIAEESVVFENALSTSSWTAPATASLFTGLYPPQHSVILGFFAHNKLKERLKKEGRTALRLSGMPEEVPTLPELFKKEGYRTFGMAANINIGSELGFDRGFDRFEKMHKASAEELHAKVAEWQKEIVQSPPFFLYLHFNDPHSPYHRHDAYFDPTVNRREAIANLYRSEIGYVDKYIRKTWELPGLAEDTVLVLLSDHGEEFWDHGRTHHTPTLYIELNRVLFMVHGPSRGIISARNSDVVGLVDVLPTLLDLIGSETGLKREGASLMPLLRKDESRARLKKQLKRRCLFGHRVHGAKPNRALWSITCGRWKLITWWDNRRALFDHRTDRRERRNIADRNSAQAGRLARRLATFKKRMAEEGKSTVRKKAQIDVDEPLLQQLQALGYVE